MTRQDAQPLFLLVSLFLFSFNSSLKHKPGMGGLLLTEAAYLPQYTQP